MTFKQILMEESAKRGVAKEIIEASLKRAVLNVGDCGNADLPEGEVAKAREQIKAIIDMVKKMSPEQKVLVRAILQARAAARAKHN